MPDQVPSRSELEREVRFGVVLFGGVSLAVYENGVVQELFSASKGKGAYTVLKQLTGSDVVLDIISGTSAGGINGILIAYALANKLDPSRCTDLWREDGDILNLLHNPSDPAPNSILNSRGYYQPRLEQAFKGLSQTHQAPDGDLVSPFEELDLFVTGTDAYGHVYTEFDSFGHPIDVKNHRALFHLRFRQDIVNDFSGDAAAYAKLSRITSCFPVAFEPVNVSENGDEPTDVLLRKWGHLRDKTIFFLDGGILDNKPFSSTLQAIFHHTQTRVVDRFLLYVEPDPEQFRPNVIHDAPNVLSAAGDGLINIPGYQSLASDLETIAEHNTRVQQYQDLENKLTQVSEDLMKSSTLSAPAVLSDTNQVPEQAVIYRSSRFSQLRERVVEGILKDKGHRILLNPERKRAAEALVKSFESWGDQVWYGTLNEFDVYYRIRRLFYVTNAIDALLNRDFPRSIAEQDRPLYRDLWRRLNHRIKLLDIVRSKMEELIDRGDFQWETILAAKDPAEVAIEIWEKTGSALRALLEVRDLPAIDAVLIEQAQTSETDRTKLEREQLVSLYNTLSARIDDQVASPFPPPSYVDRTPSEANSLLLLMDSQEWEMFNRSLGGINDSVPQHYCRFIFIDLYLFPMQRMANLNSTDKIRTVRISPIDADKGYSANAKRRLCGDELGHFGGFLKSSWRANDLMWGRLDGACQIIRCVAGCEQLRKPDPVERTSILQSIEARCPNSSVADRASFGDLLADFADAPRNSPAEKDAYSALLPALISLVQREILEEEVPKVVEASIAQQGAWNQYDLPAEISKETKRKTHRKNLSFHWLAGRHQIDKVLTIYAAVRFTEESSNPGTSPGRWVRYFEGNYDMRDETWQGGIPKPVLVEIVTTMLLVMRQCLLGIAKGRASSLSSLLGFGSWPLRLAYSLARLQRLAPEYLWNAVVAILVLCATVIGMDFYAYLYLNEKPSLKMWIIPGIILLSTLGALWVMYRPNRRSPQTPTVNVADLKPRPS